MRRRKFSREFKLEPARLVKDRDAHCPPSGSARELLRKCVREAGSDPQLRVRRAASAGQQTPQTTITVASWTTSPAATLDIVPAPTRMNLSTRYRLVG
jgi:transposase-like protein